jgi:hypothetical protein
MNTCRAPGRFELDIPNLEFSKMRAGLWVEIMDRGYSFPKYKKYSPFLNAFTGGGGEAFTRS